jgi:hypothetical protein
MQKQPTAASLLACTSTPWVNWVRDRTKEMHAGESALELFPGQRARQTLDLRVPRRLNHGDGRWMNAFEEQKLNLVFARRGLGFGFGVCRFCCSLLHGDWRR